MYLTIWVIIEAMLYPLVSVVVAVHNGESTLRDCLDSILKQTYPNFELLVVDNASTDTTKQIILSYQEKYKNIRYIFEPIKSRGAARNATIDNALGVVTLMTDVDCTVPLNWIEPMIEPILSFKEAAVVGWQSDSVQNYWTK